jgi:hypothetical protein
MGSMTRPLQVAKPGVTTTYVSRRAARATPFARTAFAAWGLMAEIIGATIVVGGAFIAALAIAGTGLVLFF